MLVHSFILSLLLVGAYAATTDRPAKVGEEAKPTDGQKSAAPLDEQNKARTHHLLSLLRPNYGIAPYPAAYPVPWNLPYSQQIVAPVHAAPVSWFSGAQTHVLPAPVHVPSAPVHVPSSPVHVVPAPVISQSTYTKPVVSLTPTVVKKPSYSVSQQVLHQPVIAEVQQIIRRPVIAEVQQVIHKPVFLEYQQAYKLPTHTVHIVKKPTFSSVAHETVEKPIVLSSEKYHVVEKPDSQVLQLPTKYVQPYSTEVVHVPSVHHQTETQTTVHHPPAVTVHDTPAVQPAVPVLPAALPAVQPAIPSVSYLPSYDYSSFGSSGLIGSGSSLGSSWGNLGSSYLGSGYGIGGSYGSLGSSFGGFGSSGYDDASVYITPGSFCRGADCQVKRDTDGRDFVVMPNSDYTSQQMIPAGYSTYNSNEMSMPTLTIPQTSWNEYYQTSKNTQDGDNSQQPTGARSSDEIGNIYWTQAAGDDQPSKDIVIPKFTEKLLGNPDFQKLVLGIYDEVKTDVRSAENMSKVSELLKALSEDEKKVLVDKVKEMMTKVDGSSTTPASVKPEAEMKNETAKET